MADPCDAADLSKAVPAIFDKADLDHLRASVSGRLEPASFTISPEALSMVRAAAQVAGASQGQIVSVGVALAAELLARREGPEFRTVLQKRAAEHLAALGGPSCPAPAPAPGK